MPVSSSLLGCFSKKPLTNYFHHDADNVGDRACGAAQYFWPDAFEAFSFNDGLTTAQTVIFGGGQVFSQTDSFSAKMRTGSQSYNLIAWGIGIPEKGKKDKMVRDVSARFSLFGTRNFEWHNELDFVPCASCMSPAFDEIPAPNHEVVIYSHRKKTPDLRPVEGIPYMTNAAGNIKQAIDFLASGDTIVTSSYHGVYWGQLLGRRVICIPYNSKFHTLQHPPIYTETENWRESLGKGKVTPRLLEEYRQININFSKRAKDILDEAGNKDE